jgi:hypothetical protein
VSYGAFKCVATREDAMFAFDGAFQHTFFMAVSIGDAGFIESKRLVLPSDLNGEQVVVHYYDQAGEVLYDNEGDHYFSSGVRYERNIHRRYWWDWVKLIEPD